MIHQLRIWKQFGGYEIAKKEFEWFCKQFSKKENLIVVTKQNMEYNQQIHLIPAPIFLIIMENNLLDTMTKHNAQTEIKSIIL